MQTLKEYAIQAQDSAIGKLRDFLFDDMQWTMRYLVVDTGGWLSRRLVLLSPHAVSSVDEENLHLVVHLTTQQIENSPPLASDQPISRQFKSAHSDYYGWTTYWGSLCTMGISFMFGISPGNVGYRIQSYHA